jgi:anti-sigma B factor antagonist
MTGTPLTSEGGGRLEFESVVLHGNAVIRLRGELDLDTADRFGEATQLVYAAGVPTLLVDLSELDFIDSSGLREVVVAHRRQVEIGGGVVLHAPNDRVRRVLEIVGLDQVLTIT